MGDESRNPGGGVESGGAGRRPGVYAGLLAGGALTGVLLGLGLGALDAGTPEPARPPAIRELAVTVEGLRLEVDVACQADLALDVVVRRGPEEIARADTGAGLQRRVVLEDLPPGEPLMVLLQDRQGLFRAGERLSLPAQLRLEGLRIAPVPGGPEVHLEARGDRELELSAWLEEVGPAAAGGGPAAPRRLTVEQTAREGAPFYRIRLPLLPAGSRAAVSLVSPDAEVVPPRVELRVPDLPLLPLLPPDPELRSLGGGRAGLAALRGERKLVFRPLTGPGRPWQVDWTAPLLGPPQVTNGRVLVREGTERVLAFDVRTGELAWDKASLGALTLAPEPFPPRKLLLTAAPGLLASPSLLVVDVREDFPFWSRWMPLASSATPRWSPVAGGRGITVATPDGRLLRLRSVDGEPLWSLSLPGIGGSSCRPALSRSGETLVVGGRAGAIRTVDLSARDRGRTRELPEFAGDLLPTEFFRALSPGPIRAVAWDLRGEVLVAGSEAVTSLDSGGGVRWSTPLPSPPGEHLLAFAGRVLISLEQGGLAILRAADGAPVALREGPPLLPGSLSSRSPGVFWGSPEEGIVYFGGGGLPEVAVPVASASPAPPSPSGS